MNRIIIFLSYHRHVSLEILATNMISTSSMVYYAQAFNSTLFYATLVLLSYSQQSKSKGQQLGFGFIFGLKTLDLYDLTRLKPLAVQLPSITPSAKLSSALPSPLFPR